MSLFIKKKTKKKTSKQLNFLFLFLHFKSILELKCIQIQQVHSLIGWLISIWQGFKLVVSQIRFFGIKPTGIGLRRWYITIDDVFQYFMTIVHGDNVSSYTTTYLYNIMALSTCTNCYVYLQLFGLFSPSVFPLLVNTRMFISCNIQITLQFIRKIRHQRILLCMYIYFSLVQLR